MTEPREPYTDVDEWTNYQEAVLAQPEWRDTVFVGGRQTGKTEVVAHASRTQAENGDHVLTIEPQHRMVEELCNRINEPDVRVITRQELVPKDGDGRITLLSAYNFPEQSELIDYDRIVVDEASYIDDTTLLSIIEDDVPTLMAGTPRYPDLGRFSSHARSDHCYTVRATTFDAPYIEEEKVMELRQNMDHEQALGELYARYRTDDRNV